MLSATSDQVSAQGWVYLRSQGLAPRTPRAAYTMLVHCHEHGEDERIALEQLGEIKGLLAGQQMNEDNGRSRHKQIDRLMTNLKRAKHLSWLRNKMGHVVAEPDKIAQTLQQHWARVSQKKGVYVEECRKCLEALSIPAAVKRSAPLLFKSLPRALVEEAMLRQVPGASPGLDGFPLPIYASF